MSEAYTCPHCKQPIYDEDALLCHFCGESLHRAGRGTLGRIRYGQGRWIWYGVGILVLLAFVWIVAL